MNDKNMTGKNVTKKVLEIPNFEGPGGGRTTRFKLESDGCLRYKFVENPSHFRLFKEAGSAGFKPMIPSGHLKNLNLHVKKCSLNCQKPTPLSVAFTPGIQLMNPVTSLFHSKNSNHYHKRVTALRLEMGLGRSVQLGPGLNFGPVSTLLQHLLRSILMLCFGAIRL